MICLHNKESGRWCVFSSSLCALGRRAPPCPADELDISQSLLKALESDSDSPPWPSLPSLHVNIDNKVRHISDTLSSQSAYIKRCGPGLSTCSLWQGEEKQLSEKSLHPPASPAMLPDHLKCNILKAQMEAAFRVSLLRCAGYLTALQTRN